VLARACEVADLGHPVWSGPDLVVIDSACADKVSSAQLARRPGVLLVTTGRPGPELWSAAVGIGAEQVLELPAGQAWLGERLADLASGAGPLGTLIAVIGGCGGVGASTLATALALSAAGSGQEPVLIGADPWDGGIDIALGAEDVPGPRWPDLATISGRLSSTAILDGLPQAHGVRFLSSARIHPSLVPLPALSAVVTAAVRTGGPVVVDLPRGAPDSARWVGGAADLNLLVCPATVAGALASRALAAELDWSAGYSGIVIRAGLGGDVDDEALASAVGLPVILRLREETQLVRDSRQGEPPGRRRRSKLAKSCAMLWGLAEVRHAEAA
jgi:secretion/DNA translocation related CpaE-like protein